MKNEVSPNKLSMGHCFGGGGEGGEGEIVKKLKWGNKIGESYLTNLDIGGTHSKLIKVP